MNNRWLFVSPQSETFTILCPHETTTLKIQMKGKLSLTLAGPAI
jgi:hypothetical protein